MSALADWLGDRRARHVVNEAEDVVASVSITTGEVLELRPRISTRQCRCGAWFYDRSRNDRCAVCRSMPVDTS